MRWIATALDVGERARVDFFDPETYKHRTTVDLEAPHSPAWIAASPDGRSFATPELPVKGDVAVRIWTVE